MCKNSVSVSTKKTAVTMGYLKPIRHSAPIILSTRTFTIYSYRTTEYATVLTYISPSAKWVFEITLQMNGFATSRLPLHLALCAPPHLWQIVHISWGLRSAPSLLDSKVWAILKNLARNSFFRSKTKNISSSFSLCWSHFWTIPSGVVLPNLEPSQNRFSHLSKKINKGRKLIA